MRPQSHFGSDLINKNNKPYNKKTKLTIKQPVKSTARERTQNKHKKILTYKK
ncbi:hypothetical protein XIS1_1100003 [Xenorhabdus innexi]|uniref:Uncharacterized protein n=1 Tax=Xenorhabdus innexi TaxID=290109 RepID=A0A1N6MQT9_9GAMM|nr:hypothetical protein XIS1_1100003 [Xenorhabdus innexi]